MSEETINKFDVGALHGANAVLFKSILDVWSKVSKGENVNLWCNGLKSCKHQLPDSEEEHLGYTVKKEEG